MQEHCLIQLTSYTDSEVVPKHLSDVPDKICAVGETIRDWLPLLTIRGIWTVKQNNMVRIFSISQITIIRINIASTPHLQPFPSISMHNTKAGGKGHGWVGGGEGGCMKLAS